MFMAACSSGGFDVQKTESSHPVSLASPISTDCLSGTALWRLANTNLPCSAYTRAAAQQGLNVDTLSALGSANLRLGRLGQAEACCAVPLKKTRFPRRMEQFGRHFDGKGRIFGEAAEVFRRAFATDNGNSDQIRENLRISLALIEDPFYDTGQNQDVKLVRRGTGDYVILTAL